MAHRENWGSRVGFLLAAIGSAIGLGNIWRFPYVAYANGGGAFLIPYFVALITAGIPIIILEIAIGHRFKSCPPKAFEKMSKKMEWLGWLQVFVSFIIVCYYAVIVAWAMKYMLYGVSQTWGENTKTFFYKTFLEYSSGPMHYGGLNFNIFIFLIILWGITWFVCFSGIKKGIEIVSKIFMPILFIIVILMIIKVITLPGAGYGLDWLFKPRFDRIFQFSTWTAAYGQIFFSLSICFGIMIAYSSYLPDKADIANNATMTAFINCGFSVLSGIAIFSVLGYASVKQGIPINEVAGGGIGLAFITIPMAINLMPASGLIGVLFFATIVVAGFTSVISLVEVSCSTIIEKFNVSRRVAATIFCFIGLVAGILFAGRSGIYLIDIVDYFMNNFGIICCGIIEIIFICWIMKLDSFKEYINRKSDFSVGRLWIFLLMILVPLFLGYMAIGNFIINIKNNYEGYPTSAIWLFGWGVCILILVLSFIMPKIKKKKSTRY